MRIDSPDTLAALALVPEQLPGYVRRVAGSELRFARGFAVYVNGGGAVLAAAPTADEPGLERWAGEDAPLEYDPAAAERVDAAIAEVASWPGLKNISVLGPARPTSAPIGLEGYRETRDCYLAVHLPCLGEGADFAGVSGQKLRNMLRRAAREVTVGVEPWSAECQALARSYAAGRVLEAGTRYIFEHLEAYAAGPGVRVFAARHRESGGLQGVCLGDFTPLATAFYMFAFRRPEAAPGTADLLLHALLAEAQRQGHERVNLGLSVNGGIGFFKEKWGARPFLPLVECSWPLVRPSRGFLRKLFG